MEDGTPPGIPPNFDPRGSKDLEGMVLRGFLEDKTPPTARSLDKIPISKYSDRSRLRMSSDRFRMRRAVIESLITWHVLRP